MKGFNLTLGRLRTRRDAPRCETYRSRGPKSATTTWVKTTILVLLFTTSAACVHAQDNHPNSTEETWTTSSTQSSMDTNPLRTSESHSKSGNRSVDKQRVEVLGTDGKYVPDYEVETETIAVDATTTRTIVRTYKWDANGKRNLELLKEEDARTTAGGDSRVVRTTSNRDVNGNLQLVQREVAEKKNVGADAQETKTTVYLADGNGGFTPSRQTQESQKSAADHSVDLKTKTLVPGANGGWEVGEVRETTISEDGKNRTTEESVSRPDLNGRFSEVSRTVGEETETAAGEKSKTVETYSTDGPGVVVDGSLHLNQRVTTVQNKDSETKTEQRVEQPNLGNPTDGMQVGSKTKYTVKYAASSTQQTKTVQVRDGSGNFSVYSTDNQKSNQPPPAQTPTESTDKPK